MGIDSLEHIMHGIWEQQWRARACVYVQTGQSVCCVPLTKLRCLGVPVQENSPLYGDAPVIGTYKQTLVDPVLASFVFLCDSQRR